MNKTSNNSPKVSVAELIQLFQTEPVFAFEQLISSGHYFHTSYAKKFWDECIKLDPIKLTQQFPQSAWVYFQLIELQHFYFPYSACSKAKEKLIQEILELNPSKSLLIKCFYLCLEFGDTDIQAKHYPYYTDESLKAIKTLLNQILPKLKNDNTDIDLFKLTRLCNNLIFTQQDITLIGTYLDSYMWAGFDKKQTENEKGHLLCLPDNQLKSENLFILNTLKNSVKRSFKRDESQNKISQEEHFQKNDPKWKTNEGLATVFYSGGGTVTSETPGTTALQVDDSFFNSDEGYNKVFWLGMEQSFHYHFRHALAQMYQPNDEVDIHALEIEIENKVIVSLFDILCAMSCLIAKADFFRYFEVLPDSGSIKSIKWNYVRHKLIEKNGILPEDIQNESNTFILYNLSEIESHYKNRPFPFVNISTEILISWFRQIEELKTKTNKELSALVNLFSRLDSPLPINPIYKAGDNFYFSYTTCIRFNLNQNLYDHYLSDKLFNNRKPTKERPLIQKTQTDREKLFTNSLKELFQKLTPYVEARLEYGGTKTEYNFSGLNGEFDLVVYFETENILIPIQVKLSNVSPRSEKRKEQWILNHIKEKGMKQVKKDVELLQTASGLKFVGDKLNYKKDIINPSIYPLIITDNFYVDHVLFPINELDKQVRCISYFEIKHLILHQKVHANQSEWKPLETESAASQLISIIENNEFWSFLNEFADNFQLSSTLSTINEKYRIEMQIL